MVDKHRNEVVIPVAMENMVAIFKAMGYREVKLWRRPHDVRKLELATSAAGTQSIALSPDGKLAAIADLWISHEFAAKGGEPAVYLVWQREQNIIARA